MLSVNCDVFLKKRKRKPFGLFWPCSTTQLEFVSNYQWQDLNWPMNCRSIVSEVTALHSELQPVPVDQSILPLVRVNVLEPSLGERRPLQVASPDWASRRPSPGFALEMYSKTKHLRENNIFMPSPWRSVWPDWVTFKRFRWHFFAIKVAQVFD